MSRFYSSLITHHFLKTSISWIDRPVDRLAVRFTRVQNGDPFIDFAMRARDDVRRNDFANFACGGGARFDGGFDCADLTSHDGGDESRVYFLISDQMDICGFD